MDNTNETDTDKVLGAWRPIEEGVKDCPSHGSYKSQLLKHRLPKAQAFWTKCPDCDRLFEQEAKDLHARYEEMMSNDARGDTEKVKDIYRLCAHVPRRYQGVDIMEWKAAYPKMEGIIQAVQDYCGCFDLAIEKGRDLIFIGSAGTGKTYAACGIINYLLDHGHRAAYTTASDFLLRLRNTYQQARVESEQEVYQALLDPELLVLDEVGRQNDSAHSASSLFNLLDKRYREVKPTVIITNMPKEQLVDFFGEALTSRLRQEGSMLGFYWPDLRGA